MTSKEQKIGIRFVSLLVPFVRSYFTYFRKALHQLDSQLQIISSAVIDHVLEIAPI